MPKYKVVTMKGGVVTGITVHDHATGKPQAIKPDADGLYTMDRAQARLVAQGHFVRAMDGEGLIAGTKSITIFNAAEKLEAAAPQPIVTREALLLRKPEELAKTAEALAIDLNADARRENRKNDYTAEELADKILAQVKRFDAVKDRVAAPAQELSSYGKR